MTNAFREPVQVIALFPRVCGLTFGQGDCPAGGTQCWNTRSTCRALEAYVDADPAPQYFTTTDRVARSLSVIARPYLISVRIQPVTLNIGAQAEDRLAIGGRARLTAAFRGSDDTGWGLDPYFGDRDDSGTDDFWAFWQAVHGNWQTIRVVHYTGKFGDDIADMECATFELQDLSVGSDGAMSLDAQDPLARLVKEKPLYPAPSAGTLALAVDAAAETLSVSGARSADYPAPCHVAIDDEVIEVSQAGDTATGVLLNVAARGALGTAPADHDAESTVQLGARFVAARADDVIHEILSAIGVPDSYQPVADWAMEVDDYLLSALVDRDILEPTPVIDLLGELQAQLLATQFWDERSAELVLRVLTGSRSQPPLLLYGTDIVEGSVAAIPRPDKRLTGVRVFYNRRSQFVAPDEPTNWDKYVLRDETLAARHGSERLREVLATWIKDRNLAADLAFSMTELFQDIPVDLEFKLDAQWDWLRPHDFVEIDVPQVRDPETGARAARQYTITKIGWDDVGHSLRVSAADTRLFGRDVTYGDDDDLDWQGGGADDYSAAFYEEETDLLPDGGGATRYC